MNKYEFSNKLTSFNKNNSHNKTSLLINELKSGKSVALVSDAGMPSICDPGEELVKMQHQRGSMLYASLVLAQLSQLLFRVGFPLPNSHLKVSPEKKSLKERKSFFK